MPSTADENALNPIHELIRRGHGAEARTALRQLISRKVPRPLLAQVAALLRRADLPWLALRLLNPIVRPTGKAAGFATEKEKAEYAAALAVIGASKEALELLRSIDAKEVPERLLYEAFALMAQWDYQATVPLLTRYVGVSSLTNYQRLVGKVNLAAALVHERQHLKADYLLKQLLFDTSLRRLSLMHGIALEQAAQSCIYQKNWSGAARFLQQANSALAGDKGTARSSCVSGPRWRRS